ncbi:MAG TPA: O-antigen ligase family protein [Gemmatimonadales bacterium]|nr:O-antigen ligase family protein [Gemmatimonadales bacterium]
MTTVAYLALWAFIFTIPWEGVIRVSGVSIVSRVAGVIALGITLLAVVMSGRFRRWHPFHFAALLFIACCGIGIFFFSFSPKIPNKFFTYIQLFAVLWMMWELAPSRRAVHGLFLSYVMGAYVAALSTIGMYRSQAALLRRFAVGGIDPNDLAMTLALALPMAWYLGLVFHRPVLRWVCRAYIPIGVFVVGLTASRGGMIVSALALTIIPLTLLRLTPGRLVGAIALLGLAAVLAVKYVPETALARLATTTTEIEDARFGGRFKLWVAGLEAYRDKPLMGYGTSGFVLAIYPKLGTQSQVAHNSYISVLVEQGLVGFLLYAGMLLSAVLATRRLPLLDRRFARVLLATTFLAMTPLTWEDRKPVWFILAAVVGLTQAMVSAREAARAGPVPSPELRRPPVAVATGPRR